MINPVTEAFWSIAACTGSVVALRWYHWATLWLCLECSYIFKNWRRYSTHILAKNFQGHHPLPNLCTLKALSILSIAEVEVLSSQSLK